LIRITSSQIEDTYNKIEDLNEEILRYNDAIDDIDEEIAFQKSMEVQA